MKYFTVLCFVCVLYNAESLPKFRFGRRFDGSIVPPKNDLLQRDVLLNWFEQKLDHFDESNNQTWLQKYFVVDDYFDEKKRNVAYIYFGGEGPMSSRWTNYGNWIETANQSGALLFLLEHRFYGESQPLPDLSTENLKYLSSRQALADTAAFIEAINKKYELAEDVKWIAFGGSYAGSMVAWLRLKYPNLVHGAIASSAPILAKLDFQEYLEIVARGLRHTSQECVDVVKQSISDLESALNDNSVNVTYIFNLCDPIEDSLNNTKDMANFFELIADNFAGFAQYNGIYEDTLMNACNILLDKSLGTPLERLAATYELSVGPGCVDYKYENTVKSLRRTVIDEDTGIMRQWVYQTCTEFGFYQTSSQKNPVFGDRFPIKFFIDLCTDIYGAEFNNTSITNAIEDTNDFYGGLDINVTNVLFTHGSVDPWHVLGRTESSDLENPSIFINGTAHCADMYPPNEENDTHELLAAKREVSRYVLNLLGLQMP